MSVKLRLARRGAKKRPFYHIVAADSHCARDGRYIEKLGVYNPLLPKTDEKRVEFDIERVRHWLSKGAKPTDRVARFLTAQGLADWKHGDNPKKAQPKAKAQERAKERADKEAAGSETPAEAAGASE
ncbi:MAG: 30S ribosomal protein S16 [Parvularculaceae bacterium]|nr:30S ribosomal protein S16 [Parvularculaceae bacterium]